VGRSAGAAPGEPARRLTEKGLTAPATIPSGWKVTERYHEATKLVPAASASAAEKLVPVAPAADSPDVGDSAQERPARDAIALPDEEPSFPLTVEEAIGARRSAERFEAEPVRLDTLNFLLKAVRANSALTRSEGIDLYLVVHRVQGLPAGLYRYDPPDHLARLERGDLRARMVRACLRQTKAGDAALGVLMVAQLARSALRAGDRSYRDLLLEAGALGQRIYLAAEAAGLTARNLAAFLDADLNALAGLDGTREAVIHLTMVGRGT
jgi:SagB-type dehydrogenase family enzyme